MTIPPPGKPNLGCPRPQRPGQAVEVVPPVTVIPVMVTRAALPTLITCESPPALTTVFDAPAPLMTALPVIDSTPAVSAYRRAGTLIVVVPDGALAEQSGSAVPLAYMIASRSEQTWSPAVV